MKRISLFLASAVLAVSMIIEAGAANVGTIDNQYPGDTEAQAQMLKDLGLFKGTDKGFELEKPMTRAEAAVMLVRLLGAEEAALEQDNAHPFLDVPSWASPYVGWLYKSGLTKGISAELYGSQKNVTCLQYSTFLTRAARDSDDYIIIPESETSPCDLNGFVRGDAVSLSARMLTEYYEKNGNTDGISVAMHLIDQGVFTKEQFRKAAWDVLPREYDNAGERGGSGENEKLSCLIANVPVIRSVEGIKLNTCRGSGFDEAAQVYGYTNEGSYKLYRIDPETLELTQIAEYQEDCYIDFFASVQDTDYVTLQKYDSDRKTLLKIKGAEVSEIDNFSWDGYAIYGGGGYYAFGCDDGIGLIDKDGIHVVPKPTEGSEVCEVADGYIVTQDRSEKQTVFSCIGSDGSVTDSVTVANRYTYPEAGGVDKEVWLEDTMPEFTGYKDGLLGGSAGVYRLKDGKFECVIDREVHDWKLDKSDGSVVAAGKGTKVIRTADDGTETVLLEDNSKLNLSFSEISYAYNGKVRVLNVFTMGHADIHAYEYEIINGKPRPVAHTPGSGYSGFSEEECKKEQERINGIYGS